MYYGTHGPFKRAEAGQAITFENDKVKLNKTYTLGSIKIRNFFQINFRHL